MIPEEYEQYWNCSTAKKGYSGTAIFTKVKPLWVQNDFDNKHNTEGRSITMEFEKFVIVCAYTPNASKNMCRLDYRVNEWDVDLHNYLKKLEAEKGKPVILTGDLNVSHNKIDVYNPTGKQYGGFLKPERESFTKLLELGFIDTFRHLYPDKVQYSVWKGYNRFRMREKNRGWRSDYFVMSEDFENHDIKLVDSVIHDKIQGSDHCPIELKLVLPYKRGSKKKAEEMIEEKSEEG